MIRVGAGVRCPACVPSTRRCAACEEQKPLDCFDISLSAKLGFKFESFCQECRRSKARDHYERHRDDNRETPARVTCTACGKRKPAAAFARDGRYRTGVLSECSTCRWLKQRERNDALPWGPIDRLRD
jgi:hypothetical protein